MPQSVPSAVDSWHLYYNSAEAFLYAAFGEKESYEIVNERLFAIFKRDITHEVDDEESSKD